MAKPVLSEEEYAAKKAEPNLDPVHCPILSITKAISSNDKPAQGFIESTVGGRLFPYTSERKSIDGETIHFWMGDTTPDADLLRDLAMVAMRHIEPLRFTHSPGSPTEFASHKLLKKAK